MILINKTHITDWINTLEYTPFNLKTDIRDNIRWFYKRFTVDNDWTIWYDYEIHYKGKRALYSIRRYDFKDAHELINDNYNWTKILYYMTSEK